MIRPTQGWVRGYRLLFALLTVGAIAYQVWVGGQKPDFRPANFFSFFTIQSNLLAAAVLLWGALAPASSWASATADRVRGAAVLYMSITGVVYGVLLSGYQEELQTTVPWVDTVVHRVMPLVMVIDWLVEPPHGSITPRSVLIWLMYPLLYVMYSLVRGPLVGWYPYPFLDPRAAGVAGVRLDRGADRPAAPPGRRGIANRAFALKAQKLCNIGRSHA
jgi:hypothetical protein